MAKPKKKPKKKSTKKKARAKAQEPAPAGPSPEAVAAAQAQLAMRQLISRFLLLPVQSIGAPQPVTHEGQAVPNLADVTVRVDLNDAQRAVARMIEAETRRRAAVGE